MDWKVYAGCSKPPLFLGEVVRRTGGVKNPCNLRQSAIQTNFLNDNKGTGNWQLITDNRPLVKVKILVSSI